MAAGVVLGAGAGVVAGGAGAAVVVCGGAVAVCDGAVVVCVVRGAAGCGWVRRWERWCRRWAAACALDALSRRDTWAGRAALSVRATGAL